MPNLNHGQEIAALDFSATIGSPMNAVVEAQAKSAMTTVKFIKEVGFEDETHPTNPGGVKYVEFKYEKTNPDDAAQTDSYLLKVPILTIVPIPYIRVEELKIKFNAKISSTTYDKNITAEQYGGSISAKAGWGWGSARLSAYYAKQKTNVSGSEVKRDYSLSVEVRAVQDEMPAGMERVLGIMEDLVAEEKIAA